MTQSLDSKRSKAVCPVQAKTSCCERGLPRADQTRLQLIDQDPISRQDQRGPRAPAMMQEPPGSPQAHPPHPQQTPSHRRCWTPPPAVTTRSLEVWGKVCCPEPRTGTGFLASGPCRRPSLTDSGFLRSGPTRRTNTVTGNLGWQISAQSQAAHTADQKGSSPSVVCPVPQGSSQADTQAPGDPICAPGGFWFSSAKATWSR